MVEPLSRFGITLPGHAVRDQLEVARYADRKGVDSLWVIETRLTTDAISPMAVYASVTDRIRVGSGVIPLWTRNPALIAQTFATLDLLAPGRIILGLGAWWEPLATQVGVDRRMAVRAMREVVQVVRSLLSLEGPVSYEGDYVHVRDLFLDHDEEGPHDVKVFIGAVGPQMLRLAGRISDGVLLNNFATVDAVRRQADEIKKGALAAGRPFEAVERAKMLLVQVTRDKREALRQIKPRIAQYVAQQPHIEGPSGVDPELSQRVKALIPWPATPAQCLEGGKLISDEVADALVCYGDEQEVRDRIGEYTAAGMTMPIASGASKETIDFLAR